MSEAQASLKVLIIEDQRTERDILKRALGAHATVQTAETASGGLGVLASHRFDFVISDLGLEGVGSAAEWMQGVKTAARGATVLIYTASPNAPSVLEAQRDLSLEVFAKANWRAIVDRIRDVKLVMENDNHGPAVGLGDLERIVQARVDALTDNMGDVFDARLLKFLRDVDLVKSGEADLSQVKYRLHKLVDEHNKGKDRWSRVWQATVTGVSVSSVLLILGFVINAIVDHSKSLLGK